MADGDRVICRGILGDIWASPSVGVWDGYLYGHIRVGN